MPSRSLHATENVATDSAATGGALEPIASQATQLVLLIQKWSAICALALIAVTFPLWFPRLTPGTFPLIPLFPWLCNCPIAVDWLASSLLLAAWFMTLLGRGRWGLGLAWIAGLCLIALNQHRLQPWHVQMMLLAIVFLVGPAWVKLRNLQWLVISIYLYSALSKADYEFLHTVGQQFLGQMVGWFGLQPANPASTPFVLAATAIPIGELITAIGLIFARTRRAFGLLACLMHLTLVILLGPVGLQHSLGVQIWNLYFAVLAVLLFVLPAIQTTPLKDQPTWSSTGRMVTASQWCLAIVLAPVLVMPLLERFGLWDHWPSWALYAPHSSRAEVWVAAVALDRLPPELRGELVEPEEGQLWVRLPLEKWSIKTLYAPIYPQSRFQLAVARYLARHLDSEFELRVHLLGVAGRFDGHRTTESFEGSTQIERAGNNFIFNTIPRGSSP